MIYYEQNLSAGMIVTEIEALLDWQTNVLRQCFFPSAQIKTADYHPPTALLDWCKRGTDKDHVAQNAVDKMQEVYDLLMRAAERAISHCQKGQALTVELFDDFEFQCEAYIMQIRRLQQDMGDLNAAIDAATGLRTSNGMYNDIRREQERFDNQGTPYVVATAIIDDVAGLQTYNDRRTMERIYAHVAGCIVRATRSFDDVYALGGGEYAIVLKHIEFNAAYALVDKMRAEIAEGAFLLAEGQPIKITASFGMTEPLQNDAIEDVVKHARSACQDALESGVNSIAEYKELSGLQRYAREIKKID